MIMVVAVAVKVIVVCGGGSRTVQLIVRQLQSQCFFLLAILGQRKT